MLLDTTKKRNLRYVQPGMTVNPYFDELSNIDIDKLVKYIQRNYE